MMLTKQLPPTKDKVYSLHKTAFPDADVEEMQRVLEVLAKAADIIVSKESQNGSTTSSSASTSSSSFDSSSSSDWSSDSGDDDMDVGALDAQMTAQISRQPQFPGETAGWKWRKISNGSGPIQGQRQSAVCDSTTDALSFRFAGVDYSQVVSNHAPLRMILHARPLPPSVPLRSTRSDSHAAIDLTMSSDDEA
eukprot:SAG22_NODE_731_length_7588_cov_6.237281_5_plen_193_part_00